MRKRKEHREERPEMVLIKIQNNHKRGIASVLEMGIGMLMGFFLSRFLAAGDSREKISPAAEDKIVEKKTTGSTLSESAVPESIILEGAVSENAISESAVSKKAISESVISGRKISEEKLPASDAKKFFAEKKLEFFSEERDFAPEDYSPEEAAADGCFVLVEGDVFANGEALRAFAEKTGRGVPDRLRIVNYYEELGDVALITDIAYDGALYHYFHDETRLGNQTRQTWKRTFGYLHVVEEGELYYLADRKEITYEEYKQSLMTSDGKGAFDQATIYWGKPSFELYAAI